MKVQNRKDIVILIIVLVIAIGCFICLYLLAERSIGQASFSVLNKENKGVSVIFQTMNKIDYPVSIADDKILYKDNQDVQIIIEPISFDASKLNDEDIKDWVRDGGKLVYLSSHWNEIYLDYGKKQSEYICSLTDTVKAVVFSYKKGFVLIGDSSILSNKTLTFDTDGAYWILQEIDKWNYKKIEFNEYYHILRDEQSSLWKDIPQGIKLILYQIVILIIITLLYKGKRFGKPVPLYEEVEREENEYIYAVASLYKHAGCWEVVLESYYNNLMGSLIKVLGKDENLSEETWAEIWKKQRMPHYYKAKKLFKFMNSANNEIKNKKQKPKEFLNMIMLCEELKKVLLKRREDYWKQDM